MTPETMNVNQTRFNHIIAFEVSKAKVLVHVLPDGTTSEVVNDRACVRRVIKRQARRNAKLGIGPLLVVCEATGSYDVHVLSSAVELDVACHRAHGSRVRYFARFRGLNAKSDEIDAPMLADYARSSADLRLYQPPRCAQVDLRELVARRTELRQMREAEEARVEHIRCQEVAGSLRDHIRSLDRLIDRLERRITALVAEDEQFQRASALMQSVKGVGPVTAASVLAYLPEIGTVSRETIAALAGLAPFDDDSGKHKGKKHIFGGREEARASLYMAAKVAMLHNAHLREMAERIKAKGKPFKLAVTAVMRKLLVILNAIVASGEPCRMAAASRQV